MSSIYEHSVLSLNHHKKDKEQVNDFADFNAHFQTKFSKDGHIFYFYDLVVSNGIKNTEDKIRDIIRANNISIVFFAPNGTNYELSIEFFKGLRDDLNVKNVLWVLDDELIFDSLTKYYAQVFDAVITCDYYAVFAYRKLGIPALYFFSNYYKNDFYPVAVEKDIDVSFVGDCTKADRIEHISYLRGNGISVKTFGEGSQNGFVKKQDMSEIFSRSKINLNFTRLNKPTMSAWFLEDNALTNLIRQNKGRPMEIALTNSFCLSEYASSLDVTFEIGKDLDAFYKKEDLLKKVRYYLDNEAMRTEMANNAYKKAITLYEADIFMPRLMGELCEVLANHRYAQREPLIYKDSIFKKNHMKQLTILMFYQFSKLKFMPAVETFTNLFQYGPLMFLVSLLSGTKIALLKFYYKVFKKLRTIKPVSQARNDTDMKEINT